MYRFPSDANRKIIKYKLTMNFEAKMIEYNGQYRIANEIQLFPTKRKQYFHMLENQNFSDLQSIEITLNIVYTQIL